jgi:Asp-tRNA(Asn)/Glu-tRNA(Gln) amidotransferase A subunit family amidase
VRWPVARERSARAGGDPGFPGISGSVELPPARMPRRIALLETAGWPRATEEAKEALRRTRRALAAAGIEIADRTSDQAIEAVEGAIANAWSLSMGINAWEGRWPLNTYARDIDRSGLSRPSQERLVKAESMTQEQYQALLVERQRVRAVHAALRDRYEACITLPATGAAPLGLGSTGDPIFVVPASLLGTPSMSLPVLQAEGLPLGLQVIGFMNEDAALFAAAGAILPILERT